MGRYKVERTWMEQKKYQLNCEVCGRIFYAAKPYGKYCSQYHRIKAFRERIKNAAG